MLVAVLQLPTGHLDLKTAFLNAELEVEIYCSPLYDHVEVLWRLLRTLQTGGELDKIAAQIRALRRGGVLRLKKAVYSLKQEPQAW